MKRPAAITINGYKFRHVMKDGIPLWYHYEVYSVFFKRWVPFDVRDIAMKLNEQQNAGKFSFLTPCEARKLAAEMYNRLDDIEAVKKLARNSSYGKLGGS